MGQAKQRGTFEERRAAAITQAERIEAERQQAQSYGRSSPGTRNRLMSRPAMMAALVGAALAGQTIIDGKR